MRDLTPWFLLLFAVETVLMMALAVPLLRRWVKPNPIYGLRTPRTSATRASGIGAIITEEG